MEHEAYLEGMARIDSVAFAWDVDVDLIAQQNCDRLAAMAAGCEVWIYEQMKDTLRGHLDSATQTALA